MTAAWVDDEPVPYTLTGAGWAAVGRLTAAASAAELGVGITQVGRLAKAGRLAGRKVAGEWVIDPASMAAYAAERSQPQPRRRRRVERLDARPLLEAVAARGGPAACGARPADVTALCRARRDGTVTVVAGDRLAVSLLGARSSELWPE